jgi:hypothetical protein
MNYDKLWLFEDMCCSSNSWFWGTLSFWFSMSSCWSSSSESCGKSSKLSGWSFCYLLLLCFVNENLCFILSSSAWVLIDTKSLEILTTSSRISWKILMFSFWSSLYVSSFTITTLFIFISPLDLYAYYYKKLIQINILVLFANNESQNDHLILSENKWNM